MKSSAAERLVLRDVESPKPEPGQVKVGLRAHGVSFVDVLMVAGQYQVKRELFVPGSEAAGVILETGPDVETVKPGERVLVNGGFSEEVVVAASRVTPLPRRWPSSSPRRTIHYSSIRACGAQDVGSNGRRF